MSAWNVDDLDEMILPPCHTMCQFNVLNDTLSCCMYQRSADLCLGLPFNIASYALLTSMIAHVTDLKVGELIISIGNAHIYKPHVEAAKEQVKRVPRQLPSLIIKRKVASIDDFKIDDFELLNYTSDEKIFYELFI
jgi:thymidylate synthase